MKISIYKNFIEECFKEIIMNYKLNLKQINDYIIKLENSRIEILIFTEFRDDDVISITLTNLQKKEFYTLFDIAQRKSILSYLKDDEKQKSIDFKDKIKSGVFADSIFIKNHCQDLLNGDFSSIGKGNPL